MTAVFDPNAAASENAGIFGLPFTMEEAKVVVVAIPFAATTSYGGGAERGPQAIFDASKQVDLFDGETGKPYEVGIAMLETSPMVTKWHDEARSHAKRVIDCGGIVEGDLELERSLRSVNELTGKMCKYVYETTKSLVARGKWIALIGGDHSTPFGAIEALAEQNPGMGVLHIDAHADLRVAYEGFTHSHASIMHNVAALVPNVARIVQVGIRDYCEQEADSIASSAGRITTFFDHELAQDLFNGVPWRTTVERIVVALPDRVYVSFDIDGLDPALCPHTGTPVPGGLSFQKASYLVGAVARSGRTIVGIDVNEVVPGPDGDEWDGNVGARILYKLIGWMVRSQQKGN